MSVTATFVTMFSTSLVVLPVGAYIGAWGYHNGHKKKLEDEYQRGVDDGSKSASRDDESQLSKLYTRTELRNAEKKGYRSGYEEAREELEGAVEKEMTKHAEQLIAQGFESGVKYAATGKLE